MRHFTKIKKQPKPIDGLVALLFNGRGGEDWTPVDGVGDLKYTLEVSSSRKSFFFYNDSSILKV